jgi:hypothetical protein
MTAESGGGAPIKPRPFLFAFLCVVFALWIGLLLLLYFKSVYPRRHPPAAAGAAEIERQ